MRPLEISVVPAVVPAVHALLRPRFPAACTTMLSARVAALGVEAESATRNVKLKVVSVATAPAVPKICPVVGSTLRPAGKFPEEMLQV